ncbi:MAG: hypothetical protein HYT62_03575, partial [Candidatus Yanofskybacteria bacterium]|nr:hypothetical protein [Candidatus Yanofskybacteria bacterium]
GSKFGEHRSLFRGDGHDFDRISEYDPQVHSLSQVDWRSMDFKKRVYVRESRVTKDFPVVIAADLSASMLFGVESQNKERMLLESMGNIGLACYHAQDPMGFIGFSEDIIFDEEPRVGEGHLYYLLGETYKFFEGLTEDGRGKLNRHATNFYNAFDFFLRKYVGKQCLLIVISDFIGVEEIVRSPILQDISSQHEVIFVFLDDPLEFAVNRGPGSIRIENIESGEQLVVTRRKYRQIGLDIRNARKKMRERDLKELRIDSVVLEYGKHFERLFRFLIARDESLRT